MILKLAILFTLNLMFNIYAYAENKISFVPKEIVFAKWGQSEDQFKLHVSTYTEGYPHDPDLFVRRYGFEMLRVSNEGNIYIQASQRKVLKFNKKGKFERAYLYNSFSDSGLFGLDEDENIYVVKLRSAGLAESNELKVEKFNNEGNLIKTYKEPETHDIFRFIMGLGSSEIIARGKKVTDTKKGPENKIRKRTYLPELNYEEVKFVYGKYGKYRIIGLKSLNPNIPDTIEIKIPVSERVIYMHIIKELGVDYKSRYFLLLDSAVGIGSHDNNCAHSVLIINSIGALFRIVHMKRENFTSGYCDDAWTKFDIDAYGNIYQVWFDTKGVHVTKWELIEK